MDKTDNLNQETISVLAKIGAKRLGNLGALVQRWENKAVTGETFTDWVMNEDYIRTTAELLCNNNASQIQEELQKKIAEVHRELSETKEDIARLISVNKDLYHKLEQAQKNKNPRVSVDIDRIKRLLSKFNKENPAAVAAGGGVTFDGHVQIDGVERLAAFLRTMRARELGVPTNVLELFKVFVLDGKLVTLSDDYHGGVGYSFLWKKTKAGKKIDGAVGWSSHEAKKYDPRLGIDPATGINYVDPETGKTWVYPTTTAVASRKRKLELAESRAQGQEGSESKESC